MLQLVQPMYGLAATSVLVVVGEAGAFAPAGAGARLVRPAARASTSSAPVVRRAGRTDTAEPGDDRMGRTSWVG